MRCKHAGRMVAGRQHERCGNEQKMEVQDNAMQPRPGEQETLSTHGLGKNHRCPITVGQEDGAAGGPVRPGLRPVEKAMAGTRRYPGTGRVGAEGERPPGGTGVLDVCGGIQGAGGNRRFSTWGWQGSAIAFGLKVITRLLLEVQGIQVVHCSGRISSLYLCHFPVRN